MKIYLNGVAVLLAALVINMVAGLFRFMNWYEFLDKPGTATIIDYIWLFIGYPICLGLAVLLIFKFQNKSK